jgi:ATP-dependent Zn protease
MTPGEDACALRIMRTRYGPISLPLYAWHRVVELLAGNVAGNRVRDLGSPSKEEVTAHHEAAHTALSRARQHPVSEVSIVPDNSSAGRVWHVPRDSRPQGENKSMSDRRFAITVVWLCGLSEAGKAPNWKQIRWTIQNLQFEARRQVLLHWPLIERIAAELVAKKELTGEQIDAIIAAVRQAEAERARARWASP